MFQFPASPSSTLWIHVQVLESLPQVGSPIRKSTGQRLFAPYRSLSQLVTSFIGSWCLGIHPMLLIAWPTFIAKYINLRLHTSLQATFVWNYWLSSIISTIHNWSIAIIALAYNLHYNTAQQSLSVDSLGSPVISDLTLSRCISHDWNNFFKVIVFTRQWD